MKEIYMNAEVVDFGNGYVRCTFNQSIDDGELEIQPISKEKALQMIWEIVLAGGKREVSVNWFDRDIVTVRAWIFLEH